MKWIIFTGTWRLTNSEVESDVRNSVRKVLADGDAIITGGATGVDYFCMDECFKLGALNKLRIFIPSTLKHFIEDYHKNWCTDPITKEDIQILEDLLIKIKNNNPTSLLEMRGKTGDITQDMYDERHNEEVLYADEVHAFQVNNSTGTQDTIDKASRVGVSTTLHKKYTI